MSATSVEEAPLPGVQPEDILRTFYAVVEPGKQNLEKAIRQVLKEVDSRKTTLDKTCNRLKKATGHHPYAVWRKSKCVDATPPVRADSSRSAGSIDTLTKTEIQDEQSDHLSALVAQEDGMLQYYAKEGDEPKIISFYSQDAGEIRRMEIERHQRIQSKRVEADRQWGLMQQQQKEGDQNMLRYLRAKQKWQHLGHQSRLDAIRYYEQDGEPVRRSRPRLARSDGSRTSRDSNSASGGNDGSNDVVGDERTHRARDRTNVKGGAGIRREFEGLDSSGQIDDFDDIQKVAYIAKGASGAVYKAKWQGMFCAVKVFEGQYSDPDVLDAFYQEVDILKNMHHENLVRFYGFGTEPTPFIVTEFLLGNLSDLLYGKKKTVELNDKRQVLITLGMANGLAFLHWKGICHRDLKSPNVLYNRDLYIKLCDFAFSKFKSKVEDETLKFESRVGTPAWMAPEVLRGEEYTLSADVYSYGVIIWEMVTRSEPFKGVNAYAIAHQVGTGGRRLEVPADCPPFWRRLMLRCWAEPDERPSSAEIVKMLQKLRTDIANGRTIADGAGEPEDPQPEPEPEPEPQPQPKPESQLESQPEPEPE
ncbi:protein kinase [bacterium]|nr:protein kinase [bacterium]